MSEDIVLGLLKYRPDNIDATLIKLVITSKKTGTVEWLWTEENFRKMLADLDGNGSVEAVSPLREHRFDLDEVTYGT